MSNIYFNSLETHLSPFNSILITVSALSSVFQLNDTSTVHFMSRGCGGYAVVLTALLV